MSADAATVVLPEVLDLNAAAPLRDQLLALRGRPVDVDAQAVAKLGGLCLQVLLAARRTWTSDGQTFRVVATSDGFDEWARLFGRPSLSTCPTTSVA